MADDTKNNGINDEDINELDGEDEIEDEDDEDDEDTDQKTEGRSRRGFAAMDPDRQREIASSGGKAAHAKGTAHQWTSEEAREAGRAGGRASRGGRRARDEDLE